MKNLRLEEIIETWNKCGNISTTDFFWLAEETSKKLETEKKYKNLKQKFDYFVSRMIDAWEEVVDDV